jgi:four helix bundle protein
MLADFRVFQLSKEFHWACKKLKISKTLRDQLLRASSSIALNIAEGSGRRTEPEQRRFYGIALGSLRECQAILELERIADPELRVQINNLGAILFTLTKAPNERNQNRNRTQTPNRNRLLSRFD